MWRPANRPRRAITSLGHEVAEPMQTASHAKQKQVRILTGRHVLLWLVAFFGIVFAVNGVLVRAAISTFGGVETSSFSKAGPQFEHEGVVAEHKDAVHWQVGGTLTRDGAGQAVLNVTARDAGGAPLTGLTAE